MKIDHIGYAVKNIDEARKNFELLGFAFEKKIKDIDRCIYIQFGNNDGYRVELIMPIENCQSPVDGQLKRNGPSPYHICFISDNIEQDIQRLLALQFKIIIPLANAIAFNNKKVVFMMNKYLGIIEIVEK